MTELAGILLRLVPLTLPLSELQRSTLHPLFSTVDVAAPRIPFHLALFLAFSVLCALTPRRYRLGWRGYWFIAAPALILTQRIVDYSAVHLLSLGPQLGAQRGALLVETGYAFVRTGLILDFVLSLRVRCRFSTFAEYKLTIPLQRLSQQGPLKMDRENLRVVSGAIAVVAASRMITTTKFAMVSQSYLVSLARSKYEQ